MGGLLMAGVDAIAADIRAPLVHQGLPPEAAVVIVAFIPILTLIAGCVALSQCRCGPRPWMTCAS